MSGGAECRSGARRDEDDGSVLSLYKSKNVF
jgi:hypothetical protein